MQSVDTLLHARWIIPVEPDNVVLEHHSIAISDGRILALLPSSEARLRYRAETELELPDHALIPGLINAHTHAAMNLMRGLADDLPLMRWLNDHIWPTEARWVSEEFVHDGTQLAMAEMLRGGVTCFNDMYFYPDVTARCAAQVGMRATVGLIVIDFPSAWAQDADEYLRKGIQLHDRYHSHPLISTAFAPHAPYTVGNAALEKVAMYAEELDVPIHMHVHETADEVNQALASGGQRPLARLDGTHDPAQRRRNRALRRIRTARRPLPGIEPQAGQWLLPGIQAASGRDQRGPGHRRRRQQQRPGYNR
jgi:5-methylthioadenosine/S-adenosylhomocysteine deaminase